MSLLYLFVVASSTTEDDDERGWDLPTLDLHTHELAFDLSVAKVRTLFCRQPFYQH